ncbi:Brp/Blh family beta-carotene 15,15'-dioxygenase [Halorussus sp. MSC15.2]|uniref:Brp/Blh family beta-carotene 15,15'-dioxygenase n=1 Tax=Halorussus sp. MSC15.2 TaxID=2283638 RepID=UPI0013D7AA66|nr:Brp/Blh family beta-carotene 15,15'-dioxygenase [Halorussus sp. MSC15.2]NEU57814.1 beta-carotene 15,15'-dioxygenase, Brp/Blh family [Halorussus sp. MSC15.2]
MAVSGERDSDGTGSAGGGPPDGFGGELFRIAVVPAWVALAAVAVAAALGVGADLPPVVRYLPFLASFVAFGLPHGAADHLAVARLGGSRPLAAVGAVYLLGGAVTLAVWLTSPALGFASFLLLTVYHWGQGDLYVLLAVGGDHLRTRGQRLLALAVRGGIPMVVPLVAFPGVYRSVAEATIRLFDSDLVTATTLDAAFRPEVRFALGGGLAALSLVAVGVGVVRGSGWTDRGWRIDALETALLWAYFLVVPPVLAVGLYFCLWHSVRHVARLLVVENDGGESLAGGRIAPAVAGFARDALPNTVGALVVLAGLASVAPPDANPASLLGLYLVLLAVLTLPHTAVVTWMDLREGVWSAE